VVALLRCGTSAAGRGEPVGAADHLGPARVDSAFVDATVLDSAVVDATVVHAAVIDTSVVHAAVVDVTELEAAVAVAERVVRRQQRHAVEVAVGQREVVDVERAGGQTVDVSEQRRGVGEFGPVAARLRGSGSGGLGGGHGRA